MKTVKVKLKNTIKVEPQNAPPKAPPTEQEGFVNGSSKNTLTQNYVIRNDNIRSDTKGDAKKGFYTGLKWILGAVFVAFLTPFVAHLVGGWLNQMPYLPSIYYADDPFWSTLHFWAKPLQGDNTDYYTVVEAETYGVLSIYLTNNDSKSLTVNNIYMDITDYQVVESIDAKTRLGKGGYSEPVYYGVQVDNSCGKYECVLLEKESLSSLKYNRLPPLETSCADMIEQVKGGECDAIDIIFSPMNPGVYRFKILIDYSIGSFSGHEETGEFSFVALDSPTALQFEETWRDLY